MSLAWSMRKEEEGLWRGVEEALLAMPLQPPVSARVILAGVTDVARYGHLLGLCSLAAICCRTGEHLDGRGRACLALIRRAFDGFPEWPTKVRGSCYQ